MKVIFRKHSIIIYSALAFSMILFNDFISKTEADLAIEDDNCIKCHVEIYYMPGNYSKEDVHFQNGLYCSGCHGGDPYSDDEEISMSV
ncbi:MAG: hypothetical protein KKD86_16685 [Bacteroidetes bacterium]|nr:hypothetical protein [Bacteroidota bacterium]MBU1680462.1 hypothetical protein [Bacteroidota bacterium]